MKPKFKVGDKITIINYGHLIWENKNTPPTLIHFPVYQQNKKLHYIDVFPDLVGQNGIITEVSTHSGDPLYAIHGLTHKTAWFNEDQLKLTQEKNVSLGIILIKKERERQINEEGWSTEHDNGHYEGELEDAARAYFYNNPNKWPWDDGYNPKDKLRNCVRAGAFIQADIDRLERFKKEIAEEIDKLHTK